MLSRCVSLWATGVVLLAATGTWAGDSSDAPLPTIIGQEQAKATRASLVGDWTGPAGTLRLYSDERFEIGHEEGTYRIEDGTLVLQTDGSEVTYRFELNGKELTLSGGDLTGPLKLTRLPRFGDSLHRRSDWSVSAMKARGRRILVIVVVVAACHVAVYALRRLLYFVIYSDRGPLKFLFRRHKNRTMTMYSLALNVSRYVIYLLAIGFILTELGVNYTMYFASLSVIGLAIGFGSQGLVQDMVTGFFIVFEEQFNVGDMVEIPPHTGIVEELGLRMTRLRNYLGQRVVIPNRNIAVVGNYLRGAQQVYLDVAVTENADAGEATHTLERVGRDVADQFQDIVLTPPASRGEISLSTGQRFLRLHLAIWPQQQWIVDQELVPRIKATMESKGFDIPGERIVVFYHPRESGAILRRARRKAERLS
ncbi:mechanosensitive ion channel family protein [Anaerobaca lacustris]|uniref:Mechanosensitive ion channel n=1 Tax=Anaerobaca lacustris TaxID=3044600 RepID=A0AAW6U3R5_9BACT|nr:mechanosensitive ion channel [Sedimentisphaerales bacterium M17dextr]